MDEFQRRDVFHKAADIVAKGWTTGVMENGEESHCMVGALRVAAYGNAYPFEWDESEGWLDDDEGIESYAGVTADVLITWNDSHAKTAEAVIERLRAMAAGKTFEWPES